MHWFLLAAAAAGAAALLWILQAANGVGRPARTQTPAEDREAFRRWLDAPGVIDDLMGAVEVLVELMAHRTLGGPGFLTLRLPQPWEDGSVIVTAQSGRPCTAALSGGSWTGTASWRRERRRLCWSWLPNLRRTAVGWWRFPWRLR